MAVAGAAAPSGGRKRAKELCMVSEGRRIRVAVLASALSLTSAIFAVAQPRSDFTPRDEFGVGATLTVAWGDCDRDGDLDLAVGNVGAVPNELYLNQGGSFLGQTPFGQVDSFAVAWADYDNDGDLDLAVAAYNAQNLLFVNTGTGTFTPQNQFGSGRTIAFAWADADLDGDLDLAVGRGILGVPQQNYLYVNNGNGTFTALARFGAGQTCTLAWGDFDNDGDPDLAVGNGGFGYGGQNSLYVNLGGNLFEERAEFGIGDTAAVAWGDANNDGWLDLTVGNWNGGPSYLYINVGDGTFMEMEAFGAADTNTLNWGDWDLDGDLDVAVGNGDFTSAGQNYLYHNDGVASFTEEEQFGLGSTDGVAWGDFDNDGDLDLAVGNEHSPSQNQLWVNNLLPTNYLRVSLVGQFHARGAGYSNRDGVGAAVTVYAVGHAGEPDYRRGFQQVEAKGGFSAQNAMDLTFGLPLDNAVDVVVRWPGSAGSALTQTLRGVAVNQHLTIVERRLGDLNCDGVVDFDDINPFVLALSDPSAYNLAYPDCDLLNADCNGDGVVDFDDINAFVALLSGR
jgi:hypothetical protein